jgi:hypothetical protein
VTTFGLIVFFGAVMLVLVAFGSLVLRMAGVE